MSPGGLTQAARRRGLGQASRVARSTMIAATPFRNLSLMILEEDEILKRCDGNLERLDELVEEAQAGIFNLRRCGLAGGCQWVRDIVQGRLSEAEFSSMIRAATTGPMGLPRQQPCCATPRSPYGALSPAWKPDATSDADGQRRPMKGKAFPPPGRRLGCRRSPFCGDTPGCAKTRKDWSRQIRVRSAVPLADPRRSPGRPASWKGVRHVPRASSEPEAARPRSLPG